MATRRQQATNLCCNFTHGRRIQLGIGGSSNLRDDARRDHRVDREIRLKVLLYSLLSNQLRVEQLALLVVLISRHFKFI